MQTGQEHGASSGTRLHGATERRTKKRRRLAEFLQISTQLVTSRMPALTPRVSFGAPVAAGELAAEVNEPITMQPIIERAKALLAEHMTAGARRYSMG